MALTDSSLTITALRYWYKASPMSKPGPAYRSFQDVIDHFKAIPGNVYLQIGKTVRAIKISKVQTALERLANRFPDDHTKEGFPYPAAIFNALAESAGTLDFQDVKEATVDGVKDAGKVALMGASAYLLIAAAAGLVFLAGSGFLKKMAKDVGL
jgi:hypothetical protein